MALLFIRIHMEAHVSACSFCYDVMLILIGETTMNPLDSLLNYVNGQSRNARIQNQLEEPKKIMNQQSCLQVQL